jgi:predicted DNA-binding protein
MVTEHLDGKCVNIRLPLEQKAFLQKYARQEGRTMTTQIQYMIKKAMAEAEKNEH